MATAAASGGPSMEVTIYVDKKKNSVVFAEANKEFVDFIFHILSLHLGAVNRILAKNTPTTNLGSLGTLQDGLKSLGAKYMENLAKDYLSGLKAPYWGRNTTLLLPEATSSNPNEFLMSVYACSSNPYEFSRSVYVCSSDQVSICRNGYVKEAVTFVVMDNLEVRPAGPTSFISLMNQYSIKDVGAIEKREFTFGTAQAIQLLNASISSKTVLTDVFLAGAIKTEK